jgi:hypothetical protein
LLHGIPPELIFYQADIGDLEQTSQLFDINQLTTVSHYQLSIAHQEFNVAYKAGREVDFSDF